MARKYYAGRRWKGCSPAVHRGGRFSAILRLVSPPAIIAALPRRSSYVIATGNADAAIAHWWIDLGRRY
jgi:hypothetical protein